MTLKWRCDLTNDMPGPKERCPTLVKKLRKSNEDNFRRCVIKCVLYIRDSLKFVYCRSL